jgi:hypothetical protein
MSPGRLNAHIHNEKSSSMAARIIPLDGNTPNAMDTPLRGITTSSDIISLRVACTLNERGRRIIGVTD